MLWSIGLPLLLVTACATTTVPVGERHETRIQKARAGLEEDPRVHARLAGVEAALASEQNQQLVDEVELRVSDDYRDENQVRVAARFPLTQPAELEAQRHIRHAETEMALSRLEETSLELRAESCFPSVEVLAHEGRVSIYAEYASRQRALQAWNSQRQHSGLVNEIDAMRFDLESLTRITTREPVSIANPATLLPALPPIVSGSGRLNLEPENLRETIRLHLPSVALRLASAERYRALMDRARVRTQPAIRFVDFSYEHESEGSLRNGGGARVAFRVPLGGKNFSDIDRYEAMAREQTGEAEGLIGEQVEESLRALREIDDFESRSDQWRELETLALRAEEIADRWWKEHLAKPEDVADLLDEAYRARSAVLDARERAGIAGCLLVAITGIPAESWPRAGMKDEGGSIDAVSRVETFERGDQRKVSAP